MPSWKKVITSGSVASLLSLNVTNGVTGSFTGSLIGTSSYSTNSSSSLYAVTASYAMNGGGGGASFPYTGSAVITGSLVVTGSVTSTTGFTGSLFGTASYATLATTASYFSGSISTAISSSYATNASSSLYAVTASYAMNGGGGGPAFPYTGDAVITGSLAISQSLFQYNQNPTITSGSAVTIMLTPTSSYNAGFFDFVITSGSNARAGTVFTVWTSGSIEFTETTTNDIGNTDALVLSASISGTNVRLQGTVTTGSWNVKVLTRFL